MHFRVGAAVKISMTIIGTTIGAGFASGREIWEFFGSYGTDSSSSIFLAMTLFWAVSIIVLYISWRYQTKNYSEVLIHVMGEKLARVFDLFILVFLLISTLVMVAGSGATFQRFSGSFLFGSVLLGIAVMIVLLYDVKGLISMNTVLMPILTVILIVVCVQFLQSPPLDATLASEESSKMPMWPSAITYAAFNILSLLAVLSTMGSQVRHSGEIWLAGFISTCCLSLMAVLYNQSLLQVESLIPQYDIPLFALMRDYSSLWVYMISLVLWLAIYTTAVSNVHGVVHRVGKYVPLPHWMIGMFIFIMLIPLSQLGFSTLVQVIYPLYGVLNLFLLSTILLYPLTTKSRWE
ncbi:hypothetical protein [Mechercharimyces sp. CAU 1602]|uniref:YkvI family membrane protein n=1 Tax=Mechercharimyces sp. CAU 1602 TaxID=2973933 RepID=UPI002161BE67|nr:hypothetical protein [Mechercharimyces sp. CAU 1602]MCS1352682.1 hypothetical protein [Mechercharimyces sp. CAU 1602]